MLVSIAHFHSLNPIMTPNSKPVHAYVIQVVILANHMNGKDTHVRGLRVLGPLERVLTLIQSSPCHLIFTCRESLGNGDDPFPFVSVNFKMHQCIR